MNWTGGQLHRHSRMGSKGHRLSFQPRLTAGDKQFTPFLDGPWKQHDGVKAEAENQVAIDDGPRTGRSSSPSGNHLEHIKRHLLEESDWAAVATARPLTVSFTAVGVTERFGKRRKLNDGDRRRLVDTNESSELAKSHQANRDLVSEVDVVRNIKIRINGRPVGFSSAESSEMAKDTLSSQSMLFGREEPAIRNQSDRGKENVTPSAAWEINTRVSLNRRPELARLSFDTPLLMTPHTPVAARSSDQDIYSIPSSDFSGKTIPRPQYPGKTNNSASPHRIFSLASQSPKIPLPRHFTIDDQILAEELGTDIGLGSLRRPLRGLSPAPPERMSESRHDSDAVSTSSWQQNKHHIDHHIPLQTPSFRLFDDAPARPPLVRGTQVLDSPDDADVSPVRIVGQPVHFHDGS
ncbi:hypothetical protein NUU61_003395 [Penicillium alfredii]|uniref:Uncharacterized protein n=1 Tax=Penicillium alfredii TaxID=1506179 RepID=A0A9W9KHX8_9EURO|nr:uncharacterized protein NUU61_003395 [Penicillium alfredii]KAJ5106048.1 hypothetical protein NUU61_003395 [Penicillium alfredii]